MYNLFNLKPTVGTNVRLTHDWLNVSKGLDDNLELVVGYYKTHTMAVDAQHYLVRLITNIGVPHSLPLDRYYSNVSNNAHDLTRVVGMTSPTNRGRVFSNIFYYDVDELLLANDDEFNYEYAYNNWKDVRAVTCLRVPHSDLGLNLPNGNSNGTEEGIGITVINLPLLCVQYKAFRDNEKKLVKSIPDYQSRSLMQFVHMYVLSNMLYSYYDNVLFNRLYNLTFGIPQGESYSRHPFHLTSWEKRLDAIQKKIIKMNTNNKFDYTTMLRNTPMVSSLNLEKLMQLPDVARTRQVMWLLISSRLKVLHWLLYLNNINKSNKDINTFNKLRKYFQRINQNNEIITQLPKKFKDTLNDEISDVSELLRI